MGSGTCKDHETQQGLIEQPEILKEKPKEIPKTVVSSLIHFQIQTSSIDRFQNQK